MRLHRTKIDYLTHTWNFYSGCKNDQNGVCAVGKHCWAKSLTKRFKAHYPNGFEPTFYPEAFMEPLKLKKPARIGCAFMGDLFGDWVDPNQRFIVRLGETDEIEMTLREWIFHTIKRTPQHSYLFLTKCPQNLPRWSFPDNCCVGTSLTGLESDFYKRVDCLNKVKANVKFISFEPLLGTIGYPNRLPTEFLFADGINWVIIGSLSQPVRHPKFEWVEEIVNACDKAGIPVFIKKPLSDVMGLQRKEFTGG